MDNNKNETKERDVDCRLRNTDHYGNRYSDAFNPRYLALMGLAPKDIPHWEYLGCPDAETYITGIDYFEHPRLCRQKLAAIYPQLNVHVPDDDEPVPHPALNLDQHTTGINEDGRHVVRWGDGLTFHWDFGKQFRTADDVFSFSPLEHPDYTDSGIVAAWDYSDEETLYRYFRAHYPAEWGNQAPPGSTAEVGTYQTMFMWPLLTFGWELFLETCLDPGFERVMDDFAELNRRLFHAFARLPINFVTCHDDIVNSRGPVCSPAWMRKYIFPRYEEFWGILKAAGKEVIFISDGRMDAYADDIFACGARGILTEPYTDFKTIARRHENCFLAGEGDTRILARNNPEEIEAMVRRMLETAHMTGGYIMRIGNEFTWNTPVTAVKHYLDLCNEMAHR
ncbi:MAG: uroporphyrinogen decarboxylase family protein [Chloroflexi bacterium]|nr:uroporphyrinogen decarboxylase family protein [Chloroflexota bacterium]